MHVVLLLACVGEVSLGWFFVFLLGEAKTHGFDLDLDGKTYLTWFFKSSFTDSKIKFEIIKQSEMVNDLIQ